MNELLGGTARPHPNPMRDRTTITLDRSLAAGASIRLFDPQGRSVPVQFSVASNTIELQRGTLAPGLYLLHIADTLGMVGVVQLMVED